MEAKVFTLSIPFANTAARKNAKKLGGQWDSIKKVWTVETTEYKINLRNLSKFIVEDVTINNEKRVDSGCGFTMRNTARNKGLVARYGFDAIEMVD